MVLNSWFTSTSQILGLYIYYHSQLMPITTITCKHSRGGQWTAFREQAFPFHFHMDSGGQTQAFTCWAFLSTHTFSSFPDIISLFLCEIFSGYTGKVKQFYFQPSKSLFFYCALRCLQTGQLSLVCLSLVLYMHPYTLYITPRKLAHTSNILPEISLPGSQSLWFILASKRCLSFLLLQESFLSNSLLTSFSAYAKRDPFSAPTLCRLKPQIQWSLLL